MSTITVEKCSACGHNHTDLPLSFYKEGAILPDFNGEKPTGYFMCPEFDTLVYVLKAEESSDADTEH